MVLTCAKCLHVLCNTAVYCNTAFSVPLFARQNTLRVRHTTAADRFLFNIVLSVGQRYRQPSARTTLRFMRDASVSVSLLWHNASGGG